MTRLRTAPLPIPTERFESADFVAACKRQPDSLVYFLLNVGDGDTQLILLPEDPEEESETRRAIVVDVASRDKVPALIEELAEHGLFPGRPGRDEVPLVVGTHPHDDHIGGMPQFLAWFGDHIVEYWDSGYYHPTRAYLESMVQLERLKRRVLITQPTSGMIRYLGTLKITAITPGVGLRTRFDTLGVNINDASIALKLEFPAARIVQRDKHNRAYRRPTAPWSLLLGADAQTASWAQASTDFPQLLAEGELRKVLKEQMGSDPLRAEIFKVPHHASKHGVNVELVERVAPNLCLVSSVGGAGRYNFPHGLALDSIREGMEPTTSGQRRTLDHDLTVLYTSDRRGIRGRQPLGSIAVMIPPRKGSNLRVWRFEDDPGDPIDLEKALRFKLRKGRRGRG
jgi:beta-lactamase superfamily II metal-dependent hydrolase